jgi:hypothetical protein
MGRGDSPAVRTGRLSRIQRCSLVVAALLGAWILYAAEGRMPETTPGRPPKMMLRLPGHPELRNLMVGSDRASYLAYLKTVEYKDQIGKVGLIADDRIFPVPAGTEVQAIGPAVAGVQDVRILSGEHFGRSAWTRAEFVNPE